MRLRLARLRERGSNSRDAGRDAGELWSAVDLMRTLPLGTAYTVSLSIAVLRGDPDKSRRR